MISNYRGKLDAIRQLLSEGVEDFHSDLIKSVLEGDDDSVREFLVSNTLWGGMGSIADQGLINEPARRKKLRLLPIELGETQVDAGFVNPRTQSWTTTFRKWIEDGVI